MEKQIYGNITNTARTQFQFDRIYPNKREMNECKDSDGIYHGRYVLIEYGENPARNATRLIERNGKFFYYDFPTVQVIPYGTPEIPATIAPGRLCYVVKDNTYIFYETYNNEAQPFKEAYRYNYNPAAESINYNTNWSIDKDKYGRGYDSTVWQKVYIDNKEKYIMVAELNTVVPNFIMTLDAPGELLEAPHLEEESNLNYNLHMPAQWDFRIKQVSENGNSDEKAIQVIKYDENGKLLSPYKENEISADIFYNKDSFNPFYYDKVNIPEDPKDQILYAPGKYYYKVYNVWGLRREEQEEDIADFDGITEFKKEINSSGGGVEEGKIQFYNESDIENLETVELKKTTETNWSYSEKNLYYRISYRKYALDTENNNPVAGRQYYKQIDDNIYIPITFTDNEPYKKDTYYYLEEGYIPDKETDTFKEDAVYYEKIGENEYQQIDLVYKPEYMKETYYTFYNQYYVKDYSATRDSKKTYYANIGDKDPVEFTVIYEPGVYYYLKEEGTYEEDPVYTIDLNDEFTPGRTYYNKTIPVLREGEDKISILPSGQSGRLYNTHIEGQAAEAAKDIQEISINFPSIGRMMFKIWNLVYGKQRRELIYGSPIYDSEMYNENGEPLYQTGIDNLNNLVGIINQVNDLIGHNIIKINNLNSIQINSDGIVIIDNKESNIKVENLDRYIYYIADSDEAEKGYYRLIKTIGVNNEYNLKLIKMSSFNNTIDTIYETLIQIQAALGTNETITTASTDSLKGTLLLLKEIIEEQSKGIDFMTIGESLTYEKKLAWKDIFGTPLYQDYNKNTFVKASYYANKEEKYENYSTHKFFTPYIKEPPEEISESSYQELYGLKRFDIKNNITSQDAFQGAGESLYYYDEEEHHFKKAESYNSNIKEYFVKNNNTQIYTLFKDCYFDGEQKDGKYLADYSIFTEKSFEEIENPFKEEDCYVVVLPSYYYYTSNEEGDENVKVISDVNIFTEVIEYYMYFILHDEPKESKQNNITIKLLEENYSKMPEISINSKGHIYSPKAGTNNTNNFILPQAIVSAKEPTNVPIGTLWYNTSTSS